MIEKKYWVQVVLWLLRHYPLNSGPFSSGKIYDPQKDPADNEALLARIDLERAIRSVGKDAERIADFLKCEEEGWFFEERARCFQLLDEVELLGRAFEE